MRVIYQELVRQIEASGRTSWVDEELAPLSDAQLYINRPEDAWQRIKTRTGSGKFLALVRELAQFREQYAQTKNVPRSRVLKDEALMELASSKPKSIADLSRSRLLLREARKGDIAQGIIAAIARGLDCAPENYPKPNNNRTHLQVNSALADMLRVLLKAKSEHASVAQRMIASAADLDDLAAGRRDIPALAGWRREVFGDDALRLCAGEIGLAARDGKVDVVELSD